MQIVLGPCTPQECQNEYNGFVMMQNMTMMQNMQIAEMQRMSMGNMQMQNMQMMRQMQMNQMMRCFGTRPPIRRGKKRAHAQAPLQMRNVNAKR